MIGWLVQGSTGVPFASQYLTISRSTPRPQIPWSAQSAILHKRDPKQQDQGSLTLDPQFQGLRIDGIGISAVHRSRRNRGGLDTVMFERAPNVRQRTQGGGDAVLLVIVHPVFQDPEMFQSVPLRTGLRILHTQGKWAVIEFISTCSGRVEYWNTTRRTKNSVSSRSAGLSYLWIRWDSW